MQQQISVVTLGVADIPRSRRFYIEGFGWTPVFEHDDIIFYQMNGFVLGTWREAAMAADMGGMRFNRPGAFNLAHNVAAKAAVAPAIESLLAAGGSLIRAAADTFYGGHAGYVGDPDGHAWEIAWNPAWTIDADGHVKFAT